MERKHTAYLFLPLYLGNNIEKMLKNRGWRLETAFPVYFYIKEEGKKPKLAVLLQGFVFVLQNQ